MTPRQLQLWLGDVARIPPAIVDVRDALEFELAHISGSISMPLETLPDTVEMLNGRLPIVVVCYGYERSVEAALLLKRRGFGDVFVLLGGIRAWALRVDATMPRY